MIVIQCYREPKKIKKLRSTKYCSFEKFIENEMYKVLYISNFTLKIRCTMLCTFQNFH